MEREDKPTTQYNDMTAQEKMRAEATYIRKSTQREEQILFAKKIGMPESLTIKLNERMETKSRVLPIGHSTASVAGTSKSRM